MREICARNHACAFMTKLLYLEGRKRGSVLAAAHGAQRKRRRSTCRSSEIAVRITWCHLVRYRAVSQRLNCFPISSQMLSSFLRSLSSSLQSSASEEMAHSDSKLFKPIRVGNVELKHRVVLAPLTRYRATKAHVPTDLMVDYYSQRATSPGGLLITEATFIAARAGGYEQVPGIWSDEQVEGWKKVVDAVHAQGCYIYMQLWQLGRAALPDVLAKPDSPENPGGPYPYVSSSDVPLEGRSHGLPRPLTHDEILEYIELFGQAAHNAVLRAGFDGVEIHGAHGYLVDQFTQDVCNKRTDIWGGSMENRSRFALEVIKKIADTVGEERTAIRLSPFAQFQGKSYLH